MLRWRAPARARQRTPGAGDLVQEAVPSSPGVEEVPHRFGVIEYRYGLKEMGHVAVVSFTSMYRPPVSGPRQRAICAVRV